MRVFTEMRYLGKDWDPRMLSRRMQNPIKGEVVLGGEQGKGIHGASRAWASACFVSGRVVVIDPERRTVDVFDFE